MLVIRFGKWNHKATPMDVYTRIFRNGCERPPFCIKKFRYVGGWQKECEMGMTINKARSVTPTIDAVHVVRCKDCKHGEPCNEGDIFCIKDIGTIESPVHQPNWFCAYGERRDDND